jgi:hypothetical protein
MTVHCPSASRWHDDGKIMGCILPRGHLGKHTDGLARWDTAHEYGGPGCSQCRPKGHHFQVVQPSSQR